MKMNGGVAKADLGEENVDAVGSGCANLGRHIENVKSFGVPAVVAINHFVTDTDAEINAVKEYVASHGVEAVLSRHWELGSEGSADLARKVAEVADAGQANFAPIYPDEMSLADKIQTIAKRIYRADEALMDQKIRFENTFRTIILYPFALSFIVTGLVWQWILNPRFGVQGVVRGWAGQMPPEGWVGEIEPRFRDRQDLGARASPPLPQPARLERPDGEKHHPRHR